MQERTSPVLLPEQLEHVRQMRFASWADRLKYAVALSGCSRAEVAAAVGLPSPNLSNLLNGRQATVSLRTALRLSRLLGMPVEELFREQCEQVA